MDGSYAVRTFDGHADVRNDGGAAGPLLSSVQLAFCHTVSYSMHTLQAGGRMHLHDKKKHGHEPAADLCYERSVKERKEFMTEAE